MGDGTIEFNDGSGGSVPKMVRTGGAKFSAFNCPEYPKWVPGANGQVLVNSVTDEKAALAAAEKALAKAQK